METIEKRWISGFWRRIAALLVDSIILGAVGFGLGLLFESTFVEMGSWGRLVGFGISLAYFGVMNSAIFKGQTIGKKLLKIRVVDASNNSISLGRSFIRYVILGTPFFLNALQFTSESLSPLLVYLIYMIVFGGLMAIPYLYLFNGATRQSLHDVLVGTYVVNAASEKQEVPPFSKVHKVVLVLLFLIAASIPFVYGNLQGSELQKEATGNDALVSVSDVLKDNAAVTNANVRLVGFMSFDEGDAKRSAFIASSVFLRTNDVENEALAKTLAQVIATNYSETSEQESVMVMLSYGYDIGIFARWNHRQYVFNPETLK